MSRRGKDGLLEKLVPVLLIASIGLAFVVGVLWERVSGFGGEGARVAGTAGQVDPQGQPDVFPDAPVAPEEISVDFEGWPALGDANAPIVIVEYSDFACPFCTRFWQETKPSIKENFIDTGKVRFVYKDFVVVGGDRAAEAAHCAGEQGKFWEYHDLLFTRHAEDRARWSDTEVHRGYARQLGLNVNTLVTCFEERRYQQKVAVSTQEAQTNGGRGTPYFLINNTPVSGAQPYSAFETVINTALAEN